VVLVAAEMLVNGLEVVLTEFQIQAAAAVPLTEMAQTL
jgi:hypothetical protein